MTRLCYASCHITGSEDYQEAADHLLSCLGAVTNGCSEDHIQANRRGRCHFDSGIGCHLLASRRD